MMTIGNNIKFTGAEYEQYGNCSRYYVDGHIVANLDFDSGDYEFDIDTTEDDKDNIYSEMIEAKERFEYNVKMSI